MQPEFYIEKISRMMPHKIHKKNLKRLKPEQTEKYSFNSTQRSILNCL